MPWHLLWEGKTGTSCFEHLREDSLIGYTPLADVIICTISKINNLKYFFSPLKFALVYLAGFTNVFKNDTIFLCVHNLTPVEPQTWSKAVWCGPVFLTTRLCYTYHVSGCCYQWLWFWNVILHWILMTQYCPSLLKPLFAPSI